MAGTVNIHVNKVWLRKTRCFSFLYIIRGIKMDYFTKNAQKYRNKR